MTTNARDEKWSEWIDWSGGTCPVFADTFVQWKGREANQNGSASIQAGNLYWEHKDDAMDIIAYRYKIKEPDSDMHPDLKWLARNETKWEGINGFCLIGKDENGVFYATEDCDHAYTYSQWLQARKDLGLIMSDAEEEMRAEEWNGYVDADDEPDNVNKPKHYQLREGYEVYDLRQDLAAKAANGGATYDQYSDWDRAIEYIIRMWGKNRLEDAKKGRWYLDKLIGKLEAQE